MVCRAQSIHRAFKDLWSYRSLGYFGLKMFGLTQREELGVRSLCSFLSHPILLPKIWMNWKSHLQPVLARLLWNFNELLPVSEAGSFGFSSGGPLISPNEPHFVCSFQLGQGWLRYLADWKVGSGGFSGFCLVSKYMKEMSWNIINFPIQKSPDILSIQNLDAILWSPATFFSAFL